MVTKQQIETAVDAVMNASGNGLLVASKHLRNVQVMGNEVIIDVISDSPVMHKKKTLEVALLKAIHARIDPKLQITVNMLVEAPAKVDDQVIKGKAIDGIKHVIAIASGKGGVGKSTVTANMAIALRDMGFKVGILDADIYGPSMPIMFDVMTERPGGIEINGVRKMDPVIAYGIKIMSVGFFSGNDQAVVWRGPMASKALNQMLHESHWGDLDFLLLDLPPGTGDIHLSIVQSLPVTGAIVVSTPQAVALADARKGVAMFNMSAIKVPVIGMVENMAYFTPEELPDNKYYLFGQEGVRRLAAQMKVDFLGEIPLVQGIREAGDVGRPAALQAEGPVKQAFVDMTVNMVSSLANRVTQLPETESVRITTMAGCSTRKLKA
ncbi:MAG: Mrp/NBP35 family ATP-binding protein [Flavobacteriales bacterium]|jgi:ATP-binding protein involved in chromosome partitioning|nr:Mrp/NBP35 family ATP-binding protein [Schleiferiaceae bacterium]|tara:strand:- start:3086 stop:4225 length:1140 start_codon:yes stop_codon:yes gene_type:complete